MGRTTLRADVHVHSKHSKRPSQWVLQKIGCPESFTEPRAIYDLARAKGMDLVTISDHNTIEGALSIAHLDGVFISEEITTYFPEDRCKVHVLALGIDERRHQDIQLVRDNIFDLVVYLNQERIAHAVAHALFGVNDRLTLSHFQRMILLFRNFELNGARDGLQNDLLARMLRGLGPGDIHRLSEEHSMEPTHDRPWEKNLWGGSDDHSSLNVSRMCTVVEADRPAAEHDPVGAFLTGLEQGACRAGGRSSTPRTMAHNLYSIAYQFYRDKFGLEKHVRKDLLLGFADRILTSSPDERPDGLLARLHGYLGYKRPSGFFRSKPRNVRAMLEKEAREIVSGDQGLMRLVRSGCPEPGEMDEDWFRFVSRASHKVQRHLADSVMDKFAGADIFDIFSALGASGSLYALLAPYFVAFSLFTKDRGFAARCLEAFQPGMAREEKPPFRLAHFTDTFHDINGVARTIGRMLRMALERGMDYEVITCGSEHATEGVTNFEAIGSCELPEYPDLTLYYPPFLSMLNHCFERGYTHIHAATPGPIGLAALGVARILGLPIVGTYHTALPQYVGELTGDTGLEEGMWRYMIWFYNQLDTVYVPSKATGRELADQGIARERIKVYPRGIDIRKFHPSKRNGFFDQWSPASETRFLYVGRVSKEKNLDVLADAFERVAEKIGNCRLIIVGKGPYLEGMEERLHGLPALFTGWLEGEQLAQAYASSDIFVFPSTTDTFGNVVLEAQASGLPAIVTSMGGPQENVDPGRTGLVVPGLDPEALAGAMVSLAASETRLAAMKRAAREHMATRSFEAAFERTWEMFRQEGPALRMAG